MKTYRTENCPDASDGIEFNLGKYPVRIGIFASSWKMLPTFFDFAAGSRLLGAGVLQLRIGKLAIAISKPPSPPVE